MIVGIGINPDKQPLFSPQERLEHLQSVLHDIDNVQIECFEGLAVDFVRHQLHGVEVKLSEELDRTLTAEIRREVPSATAQLPSTALGVGGGGQIAVDPFDRQGVRSIEPHFQFDLELPTRSGIVNIGGRAQVRFQHGWEPLAYRWFRGVRRLFLARFDV